MALTHHLLPFFKDCRVDEITIADVDRYRTSKIREREAGLVQRALSNRTINDTISRLAQVLEVAVEYGYLPANPAKGRRRRCKAPTPRRAWLEPEQIRPLLDGARPTWWQNRPVRTPGAARHSGLCGAEDRGAARAAVARCGSRERADRRPGVQDRGGASVPSISGRSCRMS